MKIPLILALDTDRGSHPCGAVNCCRHHTSTLNMRTRARVRHQSHGAMEGIAHLRYTKQPISLVSGQEVAFMAVCWYHGREYRYEVYTRTRDPWGTSRIRVPTTLKIRMPWIWEISALGFYSKSAGDHPLPACHGNAVPAMRTMRIPWGVSYLLQIIGTSCPDLP